MPDTGPAPVEEFAAVMRRLRAECPWKREQTHRSLERYLLEETHETLEAIDQGDATGDWEPLRDELGDLLLQVFFHAAIAEESGTFTLDDVARGVTAKMRRRNPHVFGDGSGEGSGDGTRDPGAPPLDAAAVDALWQAVKDRERPRSSPVDGLPPTLPALLLATKAVERGLVPADPAPEPADPADATDPGDPGDLGDRLLGLVAEAVAAGQDPEQALRDAVRRRAGSDGAPHPA